MNLQTNPKRHFGNHWRNLTTDCVLDGTKELWLVLSGMTTALWLYSKTFPFLKKLIVKSVSGKMIWFSYCFKILWLVLQILTFVEAGR